MKLKDFCLMSILNLLLFFLLLVNVSSCDIANNWYGDHYGKIKITNDSSYSISSIKILEYSDESGDKLDDTIPLSPGESRTYQNEDVLNVYFDYGKLDDNDFTRLIKIIRNGTEVKRWVYLSEGKTIELVLNDSELVPTDPIYDRGSW